MLVIFGEDIDHHTVNVLCRGENGGFEPKECGLSDAIEEVFQQIMITVGTRLPNPLWKLLLTLTGKNYAFTQMEKHANFNCIAVRDVIRRYVRKRISGEAKSVVGDNSDLLSRFLESPDVFTEDVIVDELSDFLIAGTQTTQMTTQIVLAHFATNRESLDRVRAEFDSVIDAPKDKPTSEILKDDLDTENCNEMHYLGYVIYEALRVNPPAVFTSHYHFEKDTTIGSLKVKAYDPMLISIQAMHRSSKQW